MLNYYSIDKIENCDFDTNNALVGGAIYTKNIALIENSKFDGNGREMDNSKGGAIYLKDGEYLSINNSQITNNHANEGGAIYTTGAIDVNNSDLHSNIANSNNVGIDTIGGAIYANGDVNIENTELYYNFADLGGVIYSNASVNIKNISDIFYNGHISGGYNYALKGGVIYAKGNVGIENSSILENYAIDGGAIYSESDVDFFNSFANGSGMERVNVNGGFIYGDNVNIENSTIDDFKLFTTNSHGIIYANGNIVARNSSFSNTDYLLIDSGVFGGAIHAKGNGEVYNSNFTHNNAKQYAALYVGGTLDIYDSLFFNNTHGSAFGEGRTIVNNTNFLNNIGGAQLNGRVIGTNSTLNITNSNVIGTYGESGTFNGTVFSEGNLFMENCTLNHNHAYSASSTGLIICTHSNATVKNCEFYENAFSGQDCYGGGIYAGQNAYVENCSFSNSTVYG